ncbi:sensor histidine kinase [Minwuia sp.]|uniref:sensor histidine kinase n=1 Tax=Minwuia sp. TaxID=2493630 RepID=UPI003A91524C
MSATDTRQSVWTGDFISRWTEHGFRLATYDVFFRQIRLLAIIILALSWPFIFADYLKAQHFEHVELFTAARSVLALTPLLWLHAFRRRKSHRLIDGMVFAYAMYVTLETILLMYIHRADFIVVSSRLIFFIMAANTLLPLPGRYRIIMNVTGATGAAVGIWAFAQISTDTAISLSVIVGSTYAIGFIVGSWLARMRRAEHARAMELQASNAALVAAQQRAEQASRTKSMFLANVSHELRTPLNAIIGFSDMLDRQMLGPLGHPRYKEYIGDIRWSGTHLLGLINDLLDLNRIEAGKADLQPDWLSLRQACREWLTMAGAETRADGQTIVVPPDVPDVEIRADARALHQVMINLLTNAIKYSGAGSTIRLDIARRRDGALKIDVVDNGAGMSADALSRVLQPFEQADASTARQTAGWGLGLPLVKALADAMGCRFRIESTKGEGTRACLLIPATLVRRPVPAPVALDDPEPVRVSA